MEEKVLYSGMRFRTGRNLHFTLFPILSAQSCSLSRSPQVANQASGISATLCRFVSSANVEKSKSSLPSSRSLMKKINSFGPSINTWKYFISNWLLATFCASDHSNLSPVIQLVFKSTSLSSCIFCNIISRPAWIRP